MSRPRTDDDVRDDADGERTVRVRRRRSRKSWARRKHLGLITTAVALVVLVGGVLLVVMTWDDGRPSFAQQVATSAPSGTSTSIPTDPTTASTAPTTPGSATSSGTGTAGPTTIRGNITAVGDNQWTVADTKGLTYTVVVTSETSLPRKRDFASFAVGNPVSVKGTLSNGVLTATSVVPGKS